MQALGFIAATRGDDVAAVRFGAAAQAAAHSFGAELPRIEEYQPTRSGRGPDGAEGSRPGAKIGEALQQESILSTALEAWRGAPNEREDPGGPRS